MVNTILGMNSSHYRDFLLLSGSCFHMIIEVIYKRHECFRWNPHLFFPRDFMTLNAGFGPFLAASHGPQRIRNFLCQIIFTIAIQTVASIAQLFLFYLESLRETNHRFVFWEFFFWTWIELLTYIESWPNYLSSVGYNFHHSVFAATIFFSAIVVNGNETLHVVSLLSDCLLWPFAPATRLRCALGLTAITFRLLMCLYLNVVMNSWIFWQQPCQRSKMNWCSQTHVEHE